MEEVEVVEVHSDDLLLGEVSLQLDGDDPLNRLLQHALQRAVGLLRIELLGKLLRDGGTATSLVVAEDASLDDGTAQGDIVDAGVLVETLVLGGDQRMDEVGADTVVIDRHTVAVVLIPRADELAIGRIDLGGKLIDRIGKGVHIGHIAYPAIPYGNEKHEAESHNDCQSFPKEVNDCSSHESSTFLYIVCKVNEKIGFNIEVKAKK